LRRGEENQGGERRGESRRTERTKENLWQRERENDSELTQLIKLQAVGNMKISEGSLKLKIIENGTVQMFYPNSF
jgi:hypothetical protein